MIKNNIRALLEEGIDLGIGGSDTHQLRLFKLDPLNAVANSLPGSILHTAVKHN
jgi:hypothetical protein